ncbi:MAG: hypothetical protein FWE17_01430 [Alphaproteobacteria bacterium]|nr:hypothetical protein [Alphaproteobacteria bacterium]MCL2757948.1 hypothetical protein [Alphaproteobacteria bacterium]
MNKNRYAFDLDTQLAEVLLLVPRCVKRATYDKRAISKMPSADRPDAWAERFLAAIWILKTAQTGKRFRNLEDVAACDAVKYKELKDLVCDIQKIKPNINVRLVYGKMVPEHRSFDPEIRAAVLPILCENYVTKTGGTAKFGRSNERILIAIKQLSEDVKYPNTLKLFEAMKAVCPDLDVSYETFYGRISESNNRFSKEIFNEYKKRISDGRKVNRAENTKSENERILVMLSEIENSGIVYSTKRQINLKATDALGISWGKFWNRVTPGQPLFCPEAFDIYQRILEKKR